MAKSAKQLREERAALIKQAQQLNADKADPVTGLLSAEDQATFEKMFADSEAMLAQAKNQEKLDAAVASLNDPIAPGLIPQPGASPHSHGTDGEKFIYVRNPVPGNDGKPKYERVAVGDRGQTAYEDAWRKHLAGRRLNEGEFAALRSDDAEQAGYLVASEQFATELLRNVDDLCFVRQYANITTVLGADSLGIRKQTGKASTFDWSDELTVSTEDSALAYGKKVLTPHHLTGQIKVSRDLLKRSTIPVDQIVRAEFSRNAAEKMEDGFLTGDGAKKPLGVFTASTDGISTARDVNTGSATGVTAAGLVSAKYALKSQYRKGAMGALRWLFHRDAIKLIALLTDNEGHFLFRPGQGVNGNDPDSLLGYPIDESERTPNTFTNGNYFGLLANWRFYEIADALDMEIQVLNELDARTNQVGYIGRLKCDGLPKLEEAFVRLKCAT